MTHETLAIALFFALVVVFGALGMEARKHLERRRVMRDAQFVKHLGKLPARPMTFADKQQLSKVEARYASERAS